MSDPQWPFFDPADPFPEPRRGKGEGRLIFDRRPPEIVDALVSLEDLVRICTDISPHAVNEAMDRVLGPWADRVDLLAASGRHAARVAAGAACFFGPDDDERSPAHQWSRRSPTPPTRARAQVRAVARTPWALWRVAAVGPEGVSVADATGLSPKWVPSGPVPVETFGAVAPLQVGGGLLARLVPVGGAFQAPLALSIAQVPPPEVVRGWVIEVVQAADDAPIEESLARWGHLLVRRALAWSLGRPAARR